MFFYDEWRVHASLRGLTLLGRISMPDLLENFFLVQDSSPCASEG